MKLDIDIQHAADQGCATPADERIAGWIRAALAGRAENAEISVRLVDEDESRALNFRYRGKDHATNVLSFPAGDTGVVTPMPLGDLVICAPVVAREAEQQGKPADAHWAHLCVHGVLHLLGYDHQQAPDTLEMEALEVAILARLGYQDPYRADARGQ